MQKKTFANGFQRLQVLSGIYPKSSQWSWHEAFLADDRMCAWSRLLACFHKMLSTHDLYCHIFDMSYLTFLFWAGYVECLPKNVSKEADSSSSNVLYQVVSSI